MFLFILFHFVLDDQLKQEETGSIDFGALTALPVSLDEMYEQNFECAFGRVIKINQQDAKLLNEMVMPVESHWRDTKPIIAMVMAAGEPPPETLFKEILDNEKFENILKETLSILFPIRSKVVHVMHKSIIDWLKKDNHFFTIGQSDLDQAHTKLGKQCADLIGALLDTTEKDLLTVCHQELTEDAGMNHYAIKYGIMHMCQGGMVGEAKKILFYFDWLILKCCLGLSTGLVEDGNCVLQFVEEKDKRAIELLISALKLALPAISKDKGWRELPGQLV